LDWFLVSAVVAYKLATFDAGRAYPTLEKQERCDELAKDGPMALDARIR